MGRVDRLRSMVEGLSRSSAGPSTGLQPVPLPTSCARREERLLPIRLGLRMVKGLANVHAAAHPRRPRRDVRSTRSRMSGGARACRSRRWRGSPTPTPSPASASTGARPCGGCAASATRRCPCSPRPMRRDAEPEVGLAPLTAGREVVEDYRSVQLTLRAHPLELRPARARAARRGRPAPRSRPIKDGRRIRLSGIVLIRQRPATATSPSSPSRTRAASPTSSSGSACTRNIAGRSCPRR